MFPSWTAGTCRCVLLVEEKRNRSQVTPELLLLVEMTKPRCVSCLAGEEKTGSSCGVSGWDVHLFSLCLFVLFTGSMMKGEDREAGGSVCV